MSNDLRNLEKDLRTFAKRNKNITYTKGLLMTFLITGTISLSTWGAVDTTQVARQGIYTAVTDMRQTFSRARQENQALLKGANLELIQLMEQGDQVVKSPWSSWQFGVNGYVGNWKGTYKGKGDKKEDVIYGRESKFSTSSSIDSKYGKTGLENLKEPIATVPVDASVNPKSISKTALNVNLPTINAPSAPNLNVSVADPLKISEIKTSLPEITVKPVNPDADPFSDFHWSWISNGNRGGNNFAGGVNTGAAVGDETAQKELLSGVDVTGGTFWSGVTLGTDAAGKTTVVSHHTKADNTAGFKDVTHDNKVYGPTTKITDRTYDRRHYSIINSYDGRWTTAPTAVGNKITGGTYYVAGTGGAYNSIGGSRTGTEVFHLVGDVQLSNITAYLYGNAALLTNESFRGGNTKMSNVKVNVMEDNNTIFVILGYGTGAQDATGFAGAQYSTHFEGNTDININTMKNTMYAVKNYAGGLRIDSTGDVVFNGASNIGYSFLTWVPDKSKYILSQFPNAVASGVVDVTGEASVDDYIPYVKMDSTKPMRMYGDENVGLFFNSSTSDVNKGIHQGYFNIYLNVGDKLSSNTGATKQELKGNLADKGYSDQYVDGNVGVYAISGQRTGVNNDNMSTLAFFDNDPIHDLNMDNFDMKFGKYSKDGFLFLAKNGTVIDIADHDKSGNTSFSDNSAATDDSEAGLKTIVTYANGKWTAAGTGLTSLPTVTLEDEPTEIKVRKDLITVGRKTVSYFADDGGKVTVGTSTTPTTTTATGYGSVIAYANGSKSEVIINGTIKADDSKVATANILEKYTNIGAFSENGGKITVEKNVTINGLGAAAIGTNSVVNLKGTANVINTGTSGALLAQNNGTVNFGGGTIVNKDNSAARGLTANDHTNVTPFYAGIPLTGGTAGTIVFQNDPTKANKYDTTEIEMYDGVLIGDNQNEYKKAIGAGGRYQGLENVKVTLKSDNVTLGSFDGLSTTWDSPTDASATFVGGLTGVNQFGKFDPNGHKYKTILKNGDLTITSPTVTLDSAADQYNGIQMANEVVTISNGTTVTGNVSSATIAGQGLSMGSLSTATSNATTGFNNDGTVNVTGGTTTSGIAGINVSYGTINNNATGSVTIDNGAGLYGTNGSKLVNAGTITVSGSGVGIAGLGTGTTKQDYGTDVLNAGTIGATKTVEIVNSGTINVSGNKAVAIYAENNTNAPRSNVTVDNTSALTVGDDGVGIAVVSKAPATTVNHGATPEGGVITVTSTGGTDITAGINGIGIYAEDSNININNAGGNYVVETKDNGVGIFASGNSTTNNGTLEYKYNGANTASGMGIVFDTQGTTNNTNVILNNATSTTGGIVGVYTTATTGTFTNNGNITGTSSEKEFGIVTNGANVVNNGNITLANATTQANANVGIYSKAPSTITNNGNITVGDNAIGIYGYRVNHNSGTIQTGDNGIGIYTQGTGTGSNDVVVNSAINVGTNQSVGVYAVGSGQDISSTSSSSFGIGDNSFGFVNAGTGNKITSNTPSVSLGTDAVYIYQNDATGQVFNNTNLTSTGDKNYGLYGNGTIQNNGTIDFSTGVGNVGIYSTGGVATNDGLIKVGASNTSSKLYGVGMATGHYDVTTGTFSNEGTIVNKGTIEVSQPNSMGMYAVGSNSKAVNYGNINLSGSNTIGMYLDRGAVGENWGTIQTTAGGLTSVKGVYIANGSYLKNYGTINIGASDPKSAGIWSDQSSAKNVVETATGTNPITGVSQTGTSTPAMHVAAATDEKMYGGITIKTPPAATPVSIVDANGNPVELVGIDTNIISPTPTDVIITAPSGITTLDLTATGLGSAPNTSQATSVGMYVDTSGVNYTNPINGLSNLVGLTDINLMFGVEAAKYTNAKAIQVGDNILDPYNTALAGVVSPGTTLNVTSGSLTWMAQPVKSAATGLLDTLYLVKAPYQAFAAKGDTDTYNFLDGLEQRYGTGSAREKELFNKLNDLGKGEGHIFAQAVDQMKGFQYSNVQQRLNATGNMLDKEFDYLADEWETKSKQSNKIKVFGIRDEYNTDTAGIIDYSSNGYGVAYLHEDETVKLGDTTGWYAGAVHNRFRFKDIGKSKENTTMLKAGVFKSTPFDHNNSLNWTIAGEGFIARSEMDRRFWVVDDVFESKSGYTSYGLGLKNEISKTFRTGEKTSIKPYASLDMEYGRFNNISEKSGEINLEVKGNDYFSVKPELGMEFKYRTPFAKRSILITKLNVAYENELGKLGNVGNQARVKGTTANWYNLSNEKEDRKGNVKADLNIGIENGRVGFTANLGYDTKGKNVRGGLGIRAIY